MCCCLLVSLKSFWKVGNLDSYINHFIYVFMLHGLRCPFIVSTALALTVVSKGYANTKQF